MIYVLKKVLDENYCKDLIKFYKYAKWLQEESKVTSTKEDVIDEIRRSNYIRIFPQYFKKETDLLYEKMYNYSYDLFKFDLWDFSLNIKEDIKIVKYKKGDYFNWHYDFLSEKTKTRKLNFSIQLSKSDEYQGGDLEFFNLKLEENREVGSLIIYPSFFPHRITPIINGTRYSLVGHLNGPEFR